MFKVGDLICGKRNCEYGITNEDMYVGYVINLKDRHMNIKILLHDENEFIDDVFTVLNSKTYFKLIKWR